MKLLLDSHILMWLASADAALGADARDAIFDDGNRAVVSVASVWELGIKRAKGLLQTPDDLGARLNAADFQLLDVRLDHVVRAAELPHHHGDPFDRMLVAQAQSEGAVLVTGDEALGAYDVPIMRARA